MSDSHQVLNHRVYRALEAFLPDRLFHPCDGRVPKIKGFIFSSFYYTNIMAEIYQKLKREIRSMKFEIK
jgi:hypothetical protein